MTVRGTRPRSNTERGRASRIRVKGANATKGELRTLAAYDKRVAAAADWRAKKPLLPKPPPKKSNTERGKASRYRNTPRGKLTPAQRRWLDRYEESVEKGRKARGIRAARRRNRSVAADADALARALAAWLGQPITDPGDVEKEKRGRHAQASVTMDDPSVEQMVAAAASPPSLAEHLSHGHAMSIRLEYSTGKGKTKWATVVAYTEDGELAEHDLQNAVEEAGDGYEADGIVGAAVYVGTA